MHGKARTARMLQEMMKRNVSSSHHARGALQSMEGPRPPCAQYPFGEVTCEVWARSGVRELVISSLAVTSPNAAAIHDQVQDRTVSLDLNRAPPAALPRKALALVDGMRFPLDVAAQRNRALATDLAFLGTSKPVAASSTKVGSREPRFSKGKGKPVTPSNPSTSLRDTDMSVGNGQCHRFAGVTDVASAG